MQRVVLRSLGRLVRLLSLALLAALGTSLLVRYAPGYLTDPREMEGLAPSEVQAQLEALRSRQGSLSSLLRSQIVSWAHGDLGMSRHYDVPVAELIHERALTSGRLLLQGVLCGWLAALALALPISAVRVSLFQPMVMGATSVLLAVPVGVLATLALVNNMGGPVLVLAVVVLLRDFKFLHQLFQEAWRSPHLLFARSQGFSRRRSFWIHVLPNLRRELVALGFMSLILAMSALVPVEVLFDVPGLGQLAWSAAMNRDLPVLVAVTGVLAILVGIAGFFVRTDRGTEASQCA